MIEAFPLVQTLTQQAQDMVDVLQPVLDLVPGAGGEVFQEQRQVIRQFPGIDFQTVAAVFLHQVHHGLTTVAGFPVHVFEQQQRRGPAFVEHANVVLLHVQQVAIADHFHTAQQLLLVLPRQPAVLKDSGNQGIFGGLEFFGRVLEHPGQYF